MYIIYQLIISWVVITALPSIDALSSIDKLFFDNLHKDQT